MVYLIIIVVFFFFFFFFSFFSSLLSSSLRVFFPIYPPRYAFSFPFILLAPRFLSHLSSSLRVFLSLLSPTNFVPNLSFFVFFLFFLRFPFGISPLLYPPILADGKSPSVSPPLWGLSSLFCARHLRWRVSVSVVLLSPSLVGLFSVGLFPPLWGGPGWGYSSFFSQFICICQIFFVPLHRQKHQHLQYYIHSI